jgi:hypothetical protein
MNLSQMSDEELMAFEPSNALQAQAAAAELRRRKLTPFSKDGRRQ